MNAGFLLIPFILIRYVLLYMLGGDAFKRAAHYPPFQGAEKAALPVYQAASLVLLFSAFFFKVRTDSPWFAVGLALFCAGLAALTVSTVNFSKPDGDGVNRNGLYRVSRNPMYVSYFIFFMGCVLLTRSWVMFALLLVFQVSGHWLVLAEERWCMSAFGERYGAYMSQVRRYI